MSHRAATNAGAHGSTSKQPWERIAELEAEVERLSRRPALNADQCRFVANWLADDAWQTMEEQDRARADAVEAALRAAAEFA